MMMIPKGKNLRGCQRGSLSITFSYSVSRELPEDLEYLDNVEPHSSNDPHGLIYPFEPEQLHKPSVPFKVELTGAESRTLNVKWDRCSGQEKLEKSLLPEGPNRFGR